MQCPFCRAQDTKVIDSRLAGDGEEVRRRRECISCTERFTTYETIELSLPRLIKRDGSRVQFRAEKLKSGILRALEKRPVAAEGVDNAVNRLTHKLSATGEAEIDTSLLGEWVMAELKALDEIAYLRFASVYRRFEDIHEFQKEIYALQQSHHETDQDTLQDTLAETQHSHNIAQFKSNAALTLESQTQDATNDTENTDTKLNMNQLPL